MKGGFKEGLIHISMGLERDRDIVGNIRNWLDLCNNDYCDVPEDL